MADPRTPSPHDALFKAVFGRLDIARSELEYLLPKAILAELDLSKLSIAPGLSLDDALRATHADLLYAVRTKDGGDASAPYVDVDEVCAILVGVAGSEGKEIIMNAGEQLTARGRAEAAAKAAESVRSVVFATLEDRQVSLSEIGRARIAACTDVVVLAKWVGRAPGAQTEADLFA